MSVMSENGAGVMQQPKRTLLAHSHLYCDRFTLSPSERYFLGFAIRVELFT